MITQTKPKHYRLPHGFVKRFSILYHRHKIGREFAMSKQRQVLVRLPEDLATRFAHLIAPRQRSRFLVDLLRRELDRESTELVQAALRLNELEASYPPLATETSEWVNSNLVDDDDAVFDAKIFERQFNEAKTLRERAIQQLEA